MGNETSIEARLAQIQTAGKLRYFLHVLFKNFIGSGGNGKKDTYTSNKRISYNFKKSLDFALQIVPFNLVTHTLSICIEFHLRFKECIISFSNSFVKHILEEFNT